MDAREIEHMDRQFEHLGVRLDKIENRLSEGSGRIRKVEERVTRLEESKKTMAGIGIALIMIASAIAPVIMRLIPD